RLRAPPPPPSFPTRRSSGLPGSSAGDPVGSSEAGSESPSAHQGRSEGGSGFWFGSPGVVTSALPTGMHAGHFTLSRERPLKPGRSEEHTSELQSRENLVCRV